MTRFSWDGWYLGASFTLFGLLSLIVVLASGSPLAGLGAGLGFITGTLLVWAIAADELRRQQRECSVRNGNLQRQLDEMALKLAKAAPPEGPS